MVLLRHGRPVEISPLHRILDVTVKLFSVSHEEPVLHPVGGSAHLHSQPAAAFLQLSQHIPFRSHLAGIPMRYLAAVHLKAVMMLRHGNHIPCTGLPEQLRPFVRVKMFCLKHGDKVLIAEFRMLPIGCNMMLILRRTLDVHIAGIPFAAEGRNTVDAPVDKDTEFGVLIPRGNPIGGQRFPGVLIGTLCNHTVNFFQVWF